MGLKYSRIPAIGRLGKNMLMDRKRKGYYTDSFKTVVDNPNRGSQIGDDLLYAIGVVVRTPKSDGDWMLDVIQQRAAAILLYDHVMKSATHFFLSKELVDFMSEQVLIKEDSLDVVENEILSTMTHTQRIIPKFAFAVEEKVNTWLPNNLYHQESDGVYNLINGFSDIDKQVTEPHFVLDSTVTFVLHVEGEKWSTIHHLFKLKPVGHDHDVKCRIGIVSTTPGGVLEIASNDNRFIMKRLISSLILYTKVFPESLIDGIPESHFPMQHGIGPKSRVFRLKDNEIINRHREGVTPHYRSGCFIHLVSDRYVNKKGQWVWRKETFVNRDSVKMKTVKDNELKEILSS